MLKGLFCNFTQAEHYYHDLISFLKVSDQIDLMDKVHHLNWVHPKITSSLGIPSETINSL